MTDQTSIILGQAVPVPGDLAPPLSPLAMPTQVLAPQAGVIRRVAGTVLSCLDLLRHGMRRIG